MSSSLDIFELTKDFTNDEVRFNLLLNFMKSIYQNCKEEVRNKTTKTFITKFLEHYSSEDSKYRSDPRLLKAWDLLGKTSTTLGYENVMKKLDKLGYFRTCPEFYRLWGGYCVEKKDRKVFDDLFYRVGQLFHDNAEIIYIFDEYLKKFGPRLVARDEDADATAFFFEKLGGASPLARGDFNPFQPRAQLSMVKEESEGNVSDNISNSSSGFNVTVASFSSEASSKFQEANQTFLVPLSYASSASDSTASIDMNNLTPRNESCSMEKPAEVPAENACNVSEESFSLSKEVTMQQSSSSAHAFEFTVDFDKENESIDKVPAAVPSPSHRDVSHDDKENESMDQVPAVPSPSHRDVSHDSPVLLKARKRRDSDEDSSSGDDPFADIVVPKPPGKSLFDELEDATVAGLNKESKTRASSTPIGGRPLSVPKFEVSPTATFPHAGSPEAVKEEEKPFTFAPRMK